MQKPFLLVILWAITLTQLTAQNIDPNVFLPAPKPIIQVVPAPPVAPALSLEEALEFAFDSTAEMSPLVGISASVRLPDGTIWSRSYGLTGVQKPLEPEFLMGMGSITKTFVSACILTMVEDGLLALDDSIGTYLPTAYPNVPGNVTIRQLLNHTSGIYNYSDNPDFGASVEADFEQFWSFDDVLNYYVLAPYYPPGGGFTYSNTNYVLAGKIIEVVTGQSFHTVLRERVITPAGLNNTWVYPWETPPAIPETAHLWIDIDGDGLSDDVTQIGLPLTAIFSSAGSAGCLLSNTSDLTIFMKKLFGSNDILSPSSLQSMQQGVFNNPFATLDYGLGALTFQTLDKDNWGHNGYIFFQSIASHFPEIDLSIAVQSNDFNASETIVNHVSVYLSLLEAYCNWLMSSEATEAGLKIIQLNVSPNPVQDQFQVSLPSDWAVDGQTQVEIMHIDGRRFFVPAILQNGAVRVETGNMPAGTYYFKIADQKTAAIGRFVKL